MKNLQIEIRKHWCPYNHNWKLFLEILVFFKHGKTSLDIILLRFNCLQKSLNESTVHSKGSLFVSSRQSLSCSVHWVSDEVDWTCGRHLNLASQVYEFGSLHNKSILIGSSMKACQLNNNNKYLYTWAFGPNSSWTGKWHVMCVIFMITI